MTGPAELFADSTPARRRVNGWELALWIIGLLMIAASAFLVIGLVRSFVGINSSQTQVVGFSDFFIQTSSTFTPGLLTGGIVCVALAIFARALEVNARRRMPFAVPPAPALSSADDSSVSGDAGFAPAPAGPAHPQEPAPTADYSPFMRPSGESSSDS